MAEPNNTGQALDALEATTKERSQVSVGEVMDAFGHRSWGPFLLLPALIELSPLGGIPGVPSVLATFILVVAAQMLVGKDHVWIPPFLERRRTKARRLKDASASVRPVARFLDRWFHGRLQRFTQGGWVRAAALVVLLLTLTVPPLELFPFASSLPMAAIALFGLALLVRDGALMLGAFIISGGALAAGAYLLLSGGG